MGGERVVVVGAGIAGLAAAFRLQQAGFEVRVLEAADHVGGRMWTVERDGYRVDTGALMLSVQYRELAALARDAGMAADIVKTTNTIGFMHDGAVHRLSTSNPLDGVTTSLMPVRDKVAMGRITADVVRSWRKLDSYNLGGAVGLDDENLYDYANRRGLSRTTIDDVIEPLAVSLSFADAREMSKVGFLWALRRVFGGSFFTFAGGVGAVPARLAGKLDVVLESPVREVGEHADGVRVHHDGGVEEAAAAVIALPAPSMAAVFPGLDAARRSIVGRIGYASSMHVHFGLPTAPPETASMVYTNTRRYDGLGVTFFEHNKGPGRAPTGKGLLSTYWHGDWTREHWDLDDHQIVEIARSAASRAFPGMLDETDLAFVSRANDCIVLNDPGLCREQARFDSLCDPSARIQLAGDYFSCSSTNTSLCLGERAAQRLIDRSAGR